MPEFGGLNVIKEVSGFLEETHFNDPQLLKKAKKRLLRLGLKEGQIERLIVFEMKEMLKQA